MKEKRGMKWQIFVGILLLGLVVATLFLPYAQISGKRYLSLAYEINQYAETVDPALATVCGAYEITDHYERGTSKREMLEAAYQQRIQEMCAETGTELSGWKLGIALLTLDEKLSWDGVNIHSQKDITDSGLSEVFQAMAGILYLPSLMSLLVISYMIISRRTQRLLIMLTGFVTILCNRIWFVTVPVYLWQKAQGYIVSFELVNNQVLAMDGVGEFACSSILKNIADKGFVMQFVVGVVLILYGFLCFVKWKPEMIQKKTTRFLKNKKQDVVPEMGQMASEDTQGKSFQNVSTNAENTQENFVRIEKTDTVSAPEHFFENTQKTDNDNAGIEETLPMHIAVKGSLEGLAGEYRGLCYAFEPGEEVILGRDESECTWVFHSEEIARRQCKIRYDDLMETYQVIDLSGNGTLLSNGKTAGEGSYVMAMPGTIIYLDGKKQQVKLC